MAIKHGFSNSAIVIQVNLSMFIRNLTGAIVFAAIFLINPVHPVTGQSAAAQNTLSPAANYAPATDGSETQKLRYELILEARLTEDAQSVEKGLVWRVFSSRTNSDGKLTIIGSGQGGTSSFNLPAGNYLVHASFGRAGATKRITVDHGGAREVFVLNAGGLKLNAIAGNEKIIHKKLRFSIYSTPTGSNDKPEIITRNVAADRIVRLNAGTYQVISTYGDINATVQADLRVRAGKLTEATLQHRAAKITLKLVSETGGEAIASTAWTIFSEQGAAVKESDRTFPTMVLASGNYTALARNGGQVYKKDFKVSDGKDGEVEVLAKN